jgi:voltage-gated sodium channel|tara:strand:- start:336 stop:1025 length:690 start_codon:yes stop_codon:yes gene_type:complete
MTRYFSTLKDNRIFQFTVVTIIILNAILIGATTYDLNPLFLDTIHLLDYAITIFFVIEILIRFIGEKNKADFFKSGWNIFDTIIVAISLIPIPNNSSYLVLRLLRIFRVLRLISVVPELKKIIEAILESIRRVFFVSLLLFIILYIYATMGSILFADDDPSRWGDLGISLITLFQVLTLSSWETVMLPMQAIYWWAWVYFFSFIVVCGITILNLVIAILVDVVINQKKL